MNITIGEPVLLSWADGFILARITEMQPRHLTLELRGYPNGIPGRKWVVWCRRAIGELHFKGELLWHVGLPVRTETAARMIFGEIHSLLEFKRDASARRRPSRQHPVLFESQLRFLAKQYPQTIGLFRALGPPLAAEEIQHTREAMAQAFVEETFACSKVLLTPVDDGDQLLRMGRLFARMASRERKADPVEYELIIGWYARGYCRMKLADLREAVGKAAGYKPTVDALRQKWKRLGLPSERRRGHPRSTVGK